MTLRPKASPLGEGDDDAPRAVELCTFCVSAPGGSEGHSGLSQQVHRILSTDRSYVTLACVFCGTKWVRRRINAKTFEWLRLAP